MNKTHFKRILSSGVLLYSLLLSSSCGVDSTGSPFYDPNSNQYNNENDPSDLSRRAVDGVMPRLVMKNVFFRIHKEVGVKISDLFGELIPRVPTDPVNLDDVNSFSVRVHQGNMTMNGKNMDALMKNFTLNYKDAPLSELKNVITPGRITINGKMKQAGIKVNFEMSGTITATPDGMIKVAPDKMKAAGIPVKGLLDLVGLETSKLINVNKERGMEMVGNNIILNPAKLFPPPIINGRVSKIETETDAMIMTFDDGVTMQRPPLPVAEGLYKNYKHIYGGAIRLAGNETHENTNLLIVDMNPANLFDFFLAEYMNHLMAGQVNVLNRNGTLLTTMPDYEDIPKRLNKRPVFNAPDDGVSQENLQLNPNSNPKLNKPKPGQPVSTSSRGFF